MFATCELIFYLSITCLVSDFFITKNEINAKKGKTTGWGLGLTTLLNVTADNLRPLSFFIYKQSGLNQLSGPF